MASFVSLLHRVAAGESLSASDAHAAMSPLLAGEVSDALISGFLVALRMKGETAEELAGFARAMRESMIVVDAGEDVIDTCGTGGDGSGTFNISTAAALVLAGAGAKVAKHGNRSISSQTGSTDVLEALGIRAVMTPAEAAQAVREIGIGFLFAPSLHPGMRHAQPVRRELKLRTAFNLLGPLANPARAKMQVIGAPSAAGAQLMAEALAQLGTGHAFVVHGHDGLDEITTTGRTDVYEVWTGRVEKHVWSPDHFGVPVSSRERLLGGNARHNAEIILAVLGGESGPHRDIVLINAAAGLMAKGQDARAAMAAAAHSIDSGAAAERLTQLKEMFPVG